MRTDECVMIRITITTPIRNVEHHFTPRLLLCMTLAVSGSRANLAALVTMCQSNSWSPLSPRNPSIVSVAKELLVFGTFKRPSTPSTKLTKSMLTWFHTTIARVSCSASFMTRLNATLAVAASGRRQPMSRVKSMVYTRMTAVF